MSKVFLTMLFASMVAAAPAFCATFKLPDDKPVVSLVVPDAWRPEKIERGVKGQTSDSSVYLSAETTRSEKDMNTIMDNTVAVLKQHKVTFDHGSQKEKKYVLNGLPADELLYQGKTEAGPTTVNITFVSIKDTVLVFTYWASPDGGQKHGKEISSFVQSVTAIK